MTRFVIVKDKANNETTVSAYGLKKEDVSLLIKKLMTENKLSFNVYTVNDKVTIKIDGMPDLSDTLTDVVMTSIDGVEKTKTEVDYASETNIEKMKRLTSYDAVHPWNTIKEIVFSKMDKELQKELMLCVLKTVEQAEKKTKQNFIYKLCAVKRNARTFHLIPSTCIKNVCQSKGVDMQNPDCVKTAIGLCADDDLAFILHETEKAWMTI